MCKTSKHSVQQRRRLMVCRLAACSQTIYTFIQSLTRHFCMKVCIKKGSKSIFFLRTRHFVLLKTSHSGWRINSIRQKQVKVWSYNRPGTPKGKSKEIHGLLRPNIFIVKIFETAKAWRQFRLYRCTIIFTLTEYVLLYIFRNSISSYRSLNKNRI